MKKFLILIFLFLTPALANNYPTPISGKAKAFKAADGDTIYVSIPLRLVGIDCFETSHNPRAVWQSEQSGLSEAEIFKKGLEQKTWVQNQLNKNNHNITYSFIGKDKYGRQLGKIYFPPFKKSLNAEILQKGICAPYMQTK